MNMLKDSQKFSSDIPFPDEYLSTQDVENNREKLAACLCFDNFAASEQPLNRSRARNPLLLTCFCLWVLQWLALVTVAALYNVVFIIGRAVFWELDEKWPKLWTILDALSDFIYLTDMLVHAHEGELSQPILIPYFATKYDRRWYR
ncbi:hypothetical protein J437_LFUL000773 [Ladona fulva]|uniref:Ion transport domain-containing protein n=1 Tax=Ladona fulva TaxID=123851 RepID=A0A8K0KSF9_LADFU|nr:hypothetical protein J437_LFUL000773 [Ladona fulva]